MKGASKIDDEMARRGTKCAVAVVPKTIDNDIPLIDFSFGFHSAVEAAIPLIAAANVEAASCPNGVGVVKLMGRHSGFIARDRRGSSGVAATPRPRGADLSSAQALHATLASGDVDLCLVPESDFELDAVLDHVEAVLRKQGHALVIVAEGAGQTQMGAEPK